MIGYNPNFLDNVDIFNDQELKTLSALSEQAGLDYFLSNQSLIDKFGLDFIYTSAKIEGNTYDKSDTLFLIEDGRTSGGKKYSDAKMILNLRDAYKALLANKFSINKSGLKDLHFILSNELLPDFERGTPRNSEVAIANSDYMPLATADKLNAELDYLLTTYKTIKNPFDKALYLHNNLCYLQFFRDCNKRTARVMLNVSLVASGQMLYIPDEDKIKEYKDTVVNYYETGEHTAFKGYFINNYQKVVNSITEIKNLKKQEKTQNFRGGSSSF